mgnify:CR=1 FL=1
MKRIFLVAIALLTSAVFYAQKKEIKKYEKGIICSYQSR